MPSARKPKAVPTSANKLRPCFRPDEELLRSHEHTGRPLGDEAFLATLEQDLGRTLTRQNPRPKRKTRS